MANTGTTTYPAALDAFDNPTTTTLENQSGYSHAALHSQVHDAIEAIESALGTHTAGTRIFAKRNGESLGTPDITKGTATGFEIIGGTVTSSRISGGTFVNGFFSTLNGTAGTFTNVQTNSGTFSGGLVGTTQITGGTVAVNTINSDGQNDIVITPGTAKLVKLQTIRQDITTNTYQPKTVVQSGWNYIQGDGSNTRLSKNITFPIAFTSAPIVQTTFLAFCGSTPVNIGNFTSTTDSTFEWRSYNITGSTYRAEFKTPSAAPGTANFLGFAWRAEGTIA